MQEHKRAEDMLQRGISMKQGDLDAYIAEYKVLVKMARYDPNNSHSRYLLMACLQSCTRMCCGWIALATSQSGKRLLGTPCRVDPLQALEQAEAGGQALQSLQTSIPTPLRSKCHGHFSEQNPSLTNRSRPRKGACQGAQIRRP